MEPSPQPTPAARSEKAKSGRGRAHLRSTPSHSPPHSYSNRLPQHQQQQPPSEMADPQVAGLQRAYAEIMLNMAKESAARVLAAEQRAAVLAGEVAAAKEDGVAALVRLRAIMEAKIKKVESHTLAAHVKKINVLQEQLHDAQNTVATLQVELQKANTELEQTRKTSAEERTKILPTSDKVDSNKNRGPPKMHLENRSVSLKNKTTADNICHVPTNAEENGAVENLEKLCRSGSDMSSFMPRNNKSKLYRQGCTQRVRAIKQRSHSADSSLEQNSKQACALNSCSKIGKNDTARMPSHTGSIMEQILQTKFLANCKRKRGRRSRPSYMHDSSGEHVKAEYKSSDTSDENGCLLLLQALKHDLSPPNMFTGHSGEGLTDLKDDLAMGGKDANICTASPALIDAHKVSNMQMTRRKRSKTVRVFEDGFCESKSVPISGNTLLRSNNENTVSSSEQSSERIHNSSDTPPINNAFVSSDGTENLMHPSEATQNLMHPSDANTSQLMSGNSSPPVFQSTKSQIGGEGELQVDQPENLSAGLTELKVDGSCNLASDRADPLTINSLDKEHNPKSSSRVSMQAAGSRCIKYTFNRRKRKSASLDTPPQGDVPEKSSSLAPAGSSSLADKQEPQAKPETQDPLVESPLCDSQLVRVAQQLILLSELKW